MYKFNEQFGQLKNLGVTAVKVYRVANERPLPGQKLTGGIELAVTNDAGSLVTLKAKEKATFVLAVEVGRRSDLHVVWAEGRDRVLRALGDSTPAAETVLFSKRIPTDATMNNEFVTKNNAMFSNGVWVVSTTDGRLQMWEVAVVTILADGKKLGSRESRYYLSLQKVYEGRMFRVDAAEILEDLIFIPEEDFPGYADWRSLRLFLALAADHSKLKLHTKYRSPKKERKLVELAEGQAQIVWYNQVGQQGFARVNGHEENAYFHRTAVCDQEFPAFESGQMVAYAELHITPKGTQLVGVTEL